MRRFADRHGTQGAELAGQRLGPVARAIEDRHVGSDLGQARDNPPRCAPRPEHRHRFARHPLELDVQTGAESLNRRRTVGIARFDCAIIVHRQRVRSPDGLGQGIDLAPPLLHESQQVLLMGNRHAGPPEVQRREIEKRPYGRLEVFVLRRDGQGQVHTIMTDRFKARVMQGGAEGVTDGPTDHAVDPGIAPDGIKAIELAQIVDGRLSRRGLSPRHHRGEGQKTAELRCQHAAHESKLAHAQGDGRFLSLGEQFKGLEIVAE